MKLPESLRVTIDKKHKPGLSKRFDYRNRDAEFCIIYVGCPLCFAYIDDPGNCGECPFKRFSEIKNLGCQVWIENVLASMGHKEVLFSCSDSRCVKWLSEHNAKVKQQLSDLHAAAEELIAWK